MYEAVSIKICSIGRRVCCDNVKATMGSIMPQFFLYTHM